MEGMTLEEQRLFKKSVMSQLLTGLNTSMQLCSGHITNEVRAYQENDDHYLIEDAKRWNEYARGQVDAYDQILTVLLGKTEFLDPYKDMVKTWREYINSTEDLHETEGEV